MITNTEKLLLSQATFSLVALCATRTEVFLIVPATTAKRLFMVDRWPSRVCEVLFAVVARLMVLQQHSEVFAGVLARSHSPLLSCHPH